MSAGYETVEQLFDDFIDARQRGEHPDVGVFLERAGADREALGRLIDVYLVNAPVVPPDEEAIVLIEARLAERSALVELRERRGLGLAAVIEQLREALGLAISVRPRLAEAYEDLERDWLDPRRVQPPVWAALKSIFGLDVRRLVPAHPPEPFEAVLMRRASAPEVLHDDVGEPAERDQVDELFRGEPID